MCKLLYYNHPFITYTNTNITSMSHAPAKDVIYGTHYQPYTTHQSKLPIHSSLKSNPWWQRRFGDGEGNILRQQKGLWSTEVRVYTNDIWLPMLLILVFIHVPRCEASYWSGDSKVGNDLFGAKSSTPSYVYTHPHRALLVVNVQFPDSFGINMA